MLYFPNCMWRVTGSTYNYIYSLPSFFPLTSQYTVVYIAKSYAVTNNVFTKWPLFLNTWSMCSSGGLIAIRADACIQEDLLWNSSCQGSWESASEAHSESKEWVLGNFQCGLMVIPYLTLHLAFQLLGTQMFIICCFIDLCTNYWDY